ncbi:MAG: protein disulfide oxidoreductase [Helicobacteraceae bacterium 4484_230]|nr:MAG: protein disulfide oxidoreductase [Helicobacteraceae bacterium 4484_230]
MKWNLKKILKELLVTAMLVVVFANVISYLKKPDIESDVLPEINATLINSKAFSTEAFRGKPLLIHFWATWCPTCKAEAGNIETLSKYYNVLSVAVNSGSDADLRQYMKEHELTFSILNDMDHGYADAFAVKVFPTTFVYNSSGELVFTEVGYTSTLGFLFRMWWAQ